MAEITVLPVRVSTEDLTKVSGENELWKTDFRFPGKTNILKYTHPSTEALLPLRNLARLGGWSWVEGMREGSDVEITVGD